MMNNTIADILHLNEDQQKSYLRFFAKQHLAEKIEILELHRSVFHKLRVHYPTIKNQEISYCALIKSIAVFFENEKQLKNKEFENLTIDEIESLAKKRIERFKIGKKRKKHKYEKLYQYANLIESLRNDKYSYRQIQQYLYKYHKLDISYSLIYQFHKDKK